MTEIERPALFGFLEAVFARDQGPAGFSGALAFGVVPKSITTVQPDELGTTAGVRWMHVVLGAGRPRSLFGDRLVPGVDAALALGEDEATIVVAGGSLPETARVWLSGDRKLIEQFSARYLKHRSGLSLRIQQLTGPMTAKRPPR